MRPSRDANAELAPASATLGRDITQRWEEQALDPALKKAPERPIGKASGINLDEFNKMSGGFRYLEGGPFQGPQDLIVDEVFARSEHVHAGDHVDQGVTWRVAGVVESGKLSRQAVTTFRFDGQTRLTSITDG